MVLLSCEETFVKTLDVPDLDYQERLVFQSNFKSGQDTIVAYLSRTRYALDKTQPRDPVDDGNIRLYKDQLLIAEATAGMNGEYVLPNVDISLGNYNIEVFQSEFSEELKAETTIPEYVLPNSIEYREDGGIGPDFEESVSLLRVNFNDPPGENNYYKFSLLPINNPIVMDTFINQQDTFIYEREKYNIYLSSNEISAIESRGYIIIDDEAFDGQNHTTDIVFELYNNSDEDTDINDFKLDWAVLSEDQFQFEKRLSIYRDSDDFGPFAEPVSIYSNVENGIGIFAGQNQKLLDIE